ncbi:hypothetical protein JOC49_001474 [Fusibacter tunisiensis]|uniref:Uncharacterized protein n=2 Tax=Fusibacter tunisiensis TaxID=1008308 RepID=A0ABS2MRD1_9FIRM|nr:hypothetical protein [Fusibacter tunisiensis]
MMKLKKLIYLALIVLGLWMAVSFMIQGIWSLVLPGHEVLKSVDWMGISLVILTVVLMKVAFDPSLKVELFILISGLIGHVILFLLESQILTQINWYLLHMIFVLGVVGVYIEFLKDLLSSDWVFTIRSIVLKGIGFIITFSILLGIGLVYRYAFIASVESQLPNPFELWTFLVYVPMVGFIYLHKLGFRRSIRDLQEKGYFIDDLRAAFKSQFRHGDLMLYALYGMIIFGFLSNRISYLMLYPIMVAGIYFAARGYKNWMFPFVFAVAFAAMAYLNEMHLILFSLEHALNELGWFVLKCFAVSFAFPYVLDIVTRFGVATFSSTNGD